MGEQHPTQTPPEPQVPDYAPEHFVAPDGYFDGLTERSLPTQELERRHKAAVRHENWHKGIVDGTDEAIKHTEKSDAVRASNVFATASILNKRGVTDPHSTTSDAEVPRAPEDAFSRRYGLGKFMGILMAKHSVESPNDGHRARVFEGQGGRPATNELSARQRRQSVSNAKSNFKQQVRQARSAATESTFSAGSGVGRRARTRTALANHKEKSLLRESLSKGYISPEKYLIGKKHISMSEETTVPVRAVRRDVRRERLGGAVNIARADQPVRGGVRRTLKKRAETVHENSSAKEKQHKLERARLQEELDRREQVAQDEQQRQRHEVDLFPSVLEFIGGRYRKDQPGVAYDSTSARSLGEFLHGDGPLYDQYAAEQGYTPGVSDIPDDERKLIDSYTELMAHKKAKDLLIRLRGAGIIGDIDEKTDTAPVLKNSESIARVHEEYTTA